MTAALVPAVKAFHQRLDAGGGPAYRFGTSVADAANTTDSPTQRMQTWLAVEGDQVRGGVLLQHLEMDSASGRISAVNLQLPLSEGTVDRRYAHVGMWIIRNVQRIQPRAFAVGMGGLDQPLPQLLAAMRWTVVAVPFFFHVNRPARFLRGMPLLRRTTMRRAISSFLAATGLGWMIIRGGSVVRSLAHRALDQHRGVTASPLREWGPWADAVWAASCSDLSLGVVRDHATLATLYPPVGDRTRSFRVEHAGRVVGWFVLLTTQMNESDHFGNLTVGTILDAQAVRGFEPDVLAAARRTLVAFDVDVSVTNQSHATWQRACLGKGFWPGRSNYLFAASPALVKAAGDADSALQRIQITRGDGDGRIHL